MTNHSRISDYRFERAKLQKQLDRLLDGKLMTGDQFQTGLINTTKETEAELRARISDWDTLISESDLG